MLAMGCHRMSERKLREIKFAVNMNEYFMEGIHSSQDAFQ
jgi:hypothetical protein